MNCNFATVISALNMRIGKEIKFMKIYFLLSDNIVFVYKEEKTETTKKITQSKRNEKPLKWVRKYHPNLANVLKNNSDVS